MLCKWRQTIVDCFLAFMNIILFYLTLVVASVDKKSVVKCTLSVKDKVELLKKSRLLCISEKLVLVLHHWFFCSV